MSCRYLISEEVREFSENGSAVTFGGREYKCMYDGACPFVNNAGVECPLKGGGVSGSSDALSDFLRKKRR
jgi:hypothetical protein